VPKIRSNNCEMYYEVDDYTDPWLKQTMSRTLAPANPRSCTTRRPAVSIFSRFDGLRTNLICTFVLQTSRNLGSDCCL
jgi:hypothetical protein